MEFNDLIDLLTEQLRDKGTEIAGGIVVFLFGLVVGRWRAMARWRKREFLDRLNVSLNILSDGKLLIRTLLEKSCEEVFLNRVAVDSVKSAARKTTENNPLLPLADRDYWYYLNAVLNAVAEHFAEGQIRRDMGLNVKTEQYLICLTCEQAGAVRTRKVRAMCVQKGVLANLPTERPDLESPNHVTRWETLNALAHEWREHPYKFLEMEICM